MQWYKLKMQVFLEVDHQGVEKKIVSQYTIIQMRNNPSIPMGLLGNIVCLSLGYYRINSCMKPRVIIWLHQQSIGFLFYQACKRKDEVDLGLAKFMSGLRFESYSIPHPEEPISSKSKVQ